MGRYIVVGQGLAGSILAHSLHRAGHTVKVIDNDSGAKCSRVAAGIYHPLVFKRMSLTWNSDVLFSKLETYYRELQQLLNADFYHPIPYYRYFASANEREMWIKYRSLPEYSSFLGDDTDESPLEGIKSTFGVGNILRSGWVNTNKILDSFRSYFTDNNIIEIGYFNYNNIIFETEKVTYNGFEADKIIFAEGYGVKDNPFFNYLPLKPTKGQVLTVSSDNLPQNEIVNRKVFVLPIGGDEYKVGSNYEWAWEHKEPTEEIKNELLNSLTALVEVPFEVKSHAAGIRPSVSDRRPLIGIHPQHLQLAIFNGMGSKGVMQLPYLTANFIDYLEGRAEIDPEADSKRYDNMLSL